ncbi:deoxycytidyl transferase, partial [Coemansia sp. RSA 2708]
YGEGLNRDWVRRNLATEKDFIQRYYANSRLHHLSTWKAELKDYVARLRREHHKDTAAPAAGRQRIIMHADFDCFFVSASLLSYPQLKDRPVAVCHSQQQMQVDDEGRAARMSEYSANSSQIASCNYAARSFGVKNGMFIGQARQLCPTLATVPYCFDAYKRISTAFYDIITRISGETQAVSVDEALIDVSNVVEREFQGNATALAEEIRKRVLAQTQCTVSIGIGPSILLARLATAKAKPNGVYSLDVSGYYELELGVRDLPGVGHTVEDTLGRHGIKTVADIRAVPLRRLQEICGEKTAATLHSFSRGVDDRVLESDKLRQAFGADIGWGVRFSNQDEVEDFVQRLAAEVCTSMAAADRVGSLVTLKIKKRQEGQGKPGKFLGHGICDNLSKSISLSQMTSDPVRISAACISLWQRMHVDPLDVRAVGIQVQRLNSFDNSATISDMFAKSKAQVVTGNYKQTDAGFDLPSASQLDMSVLDELPASIQEELRAALHQTSDGAGAKVFKTPDVSPAQPALPSSKSTSAKSSKGTFGSRRGRPRKLAFPTSNVKPGKTKATLLDSFRKLETLDMVMPSQMDGDVWNQLPVNIRRELARDYVRSKPPTATLESDGPAVLAEEVDLVEPAPAVPEYSGPTLLGKHSFDEVKAVVKEWACSSAGGPLDEDVAKFAEYVDSLVKAHDLTMANGVFLYFKLCIQDRQGAWQTAASAVAAKVNQTCVEMYQAQLFV